MKGTGPNSVKQQLVAAVKAGQELDLSGCTERTLSASDLRDLLSDRSVAEPGARVRLRCAVIEGDLDLSQIKTSMTLNLIDCQLTKICLGGASLPRFTLRSDPGKSRWLQEARVLRGLMGKEPALITALLFSFVVIKVIWIARGDIPTALGVFDSAGLATVIAGGLLSVFPLISAVVLGIAVFELSRSVSFTKTFPFISAPDKSFWVIGLAATVGCFFLTPWPIMVYGAGLGFLSGVAWRFASKVRNAKVKKGLGIAASVALLIAFSFLVLNPLLYAVWLPHEKLTLRGQPQMVGYVLSDSNGWVSLLRTGERRIYRFRSEDVTARALCEAGSFSMLGAPSWYNSPSSLWNKLPLGDSKTLTSCP
jgi:hypothetical protein